MFTSRSISTALKELLKGIAVITILAVWQVPACRPDLGFIFRPIGTYIIKLYPDSTHLKSGHLQSKTATGTLPAPILSLTDLFPKASLNHDAAVPTNPLMLRGVSKLTNEEKTELSSEPQESSESPDHLHFALKLSQEEITKRFLAALHEPKNSVKPTADVRIELTWNECEERMSQLTALHQAGQWIDGMTQADEFLRALDCTPSAYPEYRILAAGLAFQMAAMAEDSSQAEHFGTLAMQLSRKHENYQLEEIEASYYQVVGHKVNFAELFAAMDSLASEFADLSPEEAVKRSEALVTACGSLPATSIFRLKADLFEALAKQELESDAFDDLRRFGAIQSNADSVGNQVIKNACEPIVTELFQQIQGFARTLSEESQEK